MIYLIFLTTYVTKKASEIKSPLMQKETKTKEEKEESKDYSE